MGDSSLQFAAWQHGFIVRVTGQGTMRESPVFSDLVRECQRFGRVVADFSECGYLDSTFLGCLITLKKQNETSPLKSFVIAADASTRLRLFATSLLDRYLDFTDMCPPIIGEFSTVDAQQLAPNEFGRHVMQSHRDLAALGGKDAAAFQSIADRLEQELTE